MQTAELISRSRNGDRDAVRILVENNTGLIWSVVKRFFGRGVEPDDLFQLGSLGFLKAVEGFDPSFGTQFSTYAVPKIAGEIRRFLRDDGSVKVSRGIKERGYAVERKREELRSCLHREPTVTEIAEALGITAEEAAEADCAGKSPESISQSGADTGFSLEDVLSDTPIEERIVEHIDLRIAIGRLAERERQVIQLRYYHGLTQQRIAVLLGVSQVQISRIEKRGLSHLRQMLSEDS